MRRTIPILGEGHVTYIDHLGDDTRIADAARTSYQTKAQKTPEENRKLIRYLFLNRHTSPFEQCNVTFEINMPIFVMRQFVRHRTFRLNEWSGRYTELPDKFYLPPRWRRQMEKGQNKQGSDMMEAGVLNTEMMEVASDAFRNAYQAYKTLLALGAAKELARIVLPLATYTQIWVNMDLHNLLHFMYLRTDEHAQREVQEVAMGMRPTIKYLFPITDDLFQAYVPKMVAREVPFDENIWRTNPQT